MITYFLLMQEKVILECLQELDSPIFTVYQAPCQTDCMMNCLHVRAVSHSLISFLQNNSFKTFKGYKWPDPNCHLHVLWFPVRHFCFRIQAQDNVQVQLIISEAKLSCRTSQRQQIEITPNATSQADVRQILEIFQPV